MWNFGLVPEFCDNIIQRGGHRDLIKTYDVLLTRDRNTQCAYVWLLLYCSHMTTGSSANHISWHLYFKLYRSCWHLICTSIKSDASSLRSARLVINTTFNLDVLLICPYFFNILAFSSFWLWIRIIVYAVPGMGHSTSLCRHLVLGCAPIIEFEIWFWYTIGAKHPHRSWSKSESLALACLPAKLQAMIPEDTSVICNPFPNHLWQSRTQWL